MNSPITGGSFDPLRAPGTSGEVATTDSDPGLTPGQFVNANIPNTAFYKKRPKGSEDADKLLNINTQMKIISTDSNYVKVELDSGEVGHVPTVMVTAAAERTKPEPPLALDGAYQVYPPLPSGVSTEPLPVIDIGGAPPSGAIPAIIDPDAPIVGPAPTLNPIPVLPVEAPAKKLDPVAEEVRKKVEAAMAEDAGLKPNVEPAPTKAELPKAQSAVPKTEVVVPKTEVVVPKPAGGTLKPLTEKAPEAVSPAKVAESKVKPVIPPVPKQ